jgi:hypothetical protein
MTVREELIGIHKRLVKRLKSELYNDYCTENNGIDEYYGDYKSLTANYSRVSTKQELIEEIINSDIAYLGDYHTLKQSQETLIRILVALAQDSRQVIIGLEMIQSKSQDILWRYINNEIDEKTFLESIDYENNWGFNWNNYKEIIDYARKHQIKLVALNSEPVFYRAVQGDGEKVSSLHQRDFNAAKIITRTILNNPKSLMVVLFGDLHISENHLPFQVDDIMLQNNLTLPRKIIICQNSERIYWQLAEIGAEQNTDVVKIKEHIYCVMNSTPLTVFQSATQWFNREKELQTCLAHKNWCDKDTSTSFIEEVVPLVKIICDFLRLDMPRMDDLTVCTSHDLELLKYIKKETISHEEIKRLETELLKTESYFIERYNIICLTNVSLNHAAEQSAHFIHHYYIKDRIALIKRNQQDNFYYSILREAFGFLGSKIVNHKRMCYKELDFEDFLNQHRYRRLSQSKLKELKKISLFVKEHKKREKNYLYNSKWSPYKKISHLSFEEFIGISHALGYILGDKLYESILQGIINRSEIRELFINPFEVENESLHKYLYLVRRVQNVRETYLRKSDHL